MSKDLPAGKDIVNPDVPPGSVAGDPEEVPDPRLKEIAARIVELQARLDVSWRTLADKSGLSDAHARLAVRNLEKGKTITLTTLLKIADGAGVSPGWLVSGEGVGGRLRDLPSWADLVRETKARYPDVPDFAVDQVGSFSLPNPPDRLDASTVKEMARAWFDAASDDLRRRVETAYVDRLRPKRPT